MEGFTIGPTDTSHWPGGPFYSVTSSRPSQLTILWFLVCTTLVLRRWRKSVVDSYGEPTARGGHKKALIAWGDITRPLAAGGIGIQPFEDQAVAVKMRHVIKLISGECKEWTTMECSLIRSTLSSGPHKKERRNWTAAEALLFMIKSKAIIQGCAFL